MTTATKRRRLRRGLLITGAALSATLAVPAIASAEQFGGDILSTNESLCRSQYAATRVQFEGTANGAGARFTLFRNSSKVYGDFAQGLFGRFTTENGFFPGPGYYTFCGLNKEATNQFVTVRILTDNEVPPF